MTETRLLAIRSKEGRGVYTLPSMKQRNELIIKYAGKLDGVSCRTFKITDKAAALAWIDIGKDKKLLAIKNKKGRGVYEFNTKEQMNELISEKAGKRKGVSYRTFEINQKEEALAWAGVSKSTNTKQKNKAKTSAKKQEDKHVLKKMPREIELDVIHIYSDCRTYLNWYYWEGGHSVAHGDFKGKVEKIDNRGILFKRLYVDFFESDGNGVEGKEDHIWIYDKTPFIKKKVKVGDCVAFTGLVYAYKRADESIDFSLKECEDIEIIEKYELPTDEVLAKQSAERIACEVCLYSEHCNGLVCIAADGYLGTMTASILNAQKKLKLQ